MLLCVCVIKDVDQGTLKLPVYIIAQQVGAMFVYDVSFLHVIFVHYTL